MELLVIGDRVMTFVNDRKISEYEDVPRRSARGHIALQLIGGATKVEFRSIEVKELNPATAADTAKPAAMPVSRRAIVPATEASKSLRIEGDELVQTKAVRDFTPIRFGDPGWTDYDFSVRIKCEDRGMVFVHVRDRPGLGGYGYKLGTGTFPEEVINLIYKEANPRLGVRMTDGLPSDRWHDVRVSVRGDRIQCFLDGQRTFDVSDSLHPYGNVYLRSWNVPCRFRDIKVTAPDGKVLWEGLPELPE
jgi:hypothetical protein